MKRLVWTGRLFAAVLLGCTVAGASAQVKVADAWARATVPAQKASGAFMRVTAEKDARLVGVKSPVAGVAELHEMSMVDNLMKMRAVEAIDLPAGRVVEFKPGGYHVMLLDLKQQLKEGETVPITLLVEGKDGSRSSVEVTAAVRAAQGAGMQHKH